MTIAVVCKAVLYKRPATGEALKPMDHAYSCNHGTFEFGCPGGCHGDAKKHGADAEAVALFLDSVGHREGKQLVQVKERMRLADIEHLGPDVVELYQANYGPSWLAEGVTVQPSVV